MNQKGQLSFLAILGGLGDWFSNLPGTIKVIIFFIVILLFGGTIAAITNPIATPVAGAVGVDYKFEYLEIIFGLVVVLVVIGGISAWNSQ